MGLSRFVSQVSASAPVVAANQFPNQATITDLSLSVTPSVPLTARPGNRRGFIIENDGTVPIIYANGSTVSVAVRTALLFPNDVWTDDTGWQGPVALASVGSAGTANITEMVYI